VPWKNPTQSSTVLLAYFWLTSSTTAFASDGRYRMVRVGKGIAAAGDDDEEVSSDILPSYWLALIS
jgi:hypothetical protein